MTHIAKPPTVICYGDELNGCVTACPRCGTEFKFRIDRILCNKCLAAERDARKKEMK